jgi:hypothetical protein
LSITVSGADGAIQPPFIAGALPAEVTAVVFVNPAPSVTIDVGLPAASVDVEIVGVSIAVNSADGEVTTNSVSAEVT